MFKVLSYGKITEIFKVGLIIKKDIVMIDTRLKVGLIIVGILVVVVIIGLGIFEYLTGTRLGVEIQQVSCTEIGDLQVDKTEEANLIYVGAGKNQTSAWFEKISSGMGLITSEKAVDVTNLIEKKDGDCFRMKAPVIPMTDVGRIHSLHVVFPVANLGNNISGYYDFVLTIGQVMGGDYYIDIDYVKPVVKNGNLYIKILYRTNKPDLISSRLQYSKINPILKKLEDSNYVYSIYGDPIRDIQIPFIKSPNWVWNNISQRVDIDKTFIYVSSKRVYKEQKYLSGALELIKRLDRKFTMKEDEPYIWDNTKVSANTIKGIMSELWKEGYSTSITYDDMAFGEVIKPDLRRNVGNDVQPVFVATEPDLEFPLSLIEDGKKSEETIKIISGEVIPSIFDITAYTEEDSNQNVYFKINGGKRIFAMIASPAYNVNIKTTSEQTMLKSDTFRYGSENEIEAWIEGRQEEGGGNMISLDLTVYTEFGEKHVINIFDKEPVSSKEHAKKTIYIPKLNYETSIK